MTGAPATAPAPAPVGAVPGAGQSLLAPGTVLLVGASEDPARAGGRILANLRRWAFPGQVLCVGRTPRPQGRQDGRGREKWFTGIADALAGAGEHGGVDMAIVAVGVEGTPAVLDELASGAVGVAIVLANATGGPELDGLRRAVAGLRSCSPMRVLGPNTAGVIVPGARLPASMMRRLSGAEPAAPGGLAIVSNSGGVANELMWGCLGHGTDLAAWVSLGVEADVTAGDVMTWLADDDRVTNVVTILESVHRPDHYLAGARRLAEAGKPVYAYRSLRSAGASRAATLHSGTVRVPGGMWSAVLAWQGVTELEGMDELAWYVAATGGLDAARDLAPPTDRGGALGVALVSMSGGATVAAVDRGGPSGLDFDVDLAPPTIAALRRLGVDELPADLAGRDATASAETFAAVVAGVLPDPHVDVVWVQASLVYFAPDDLGRLVAAIEPVAAEYRKLVLVSGLLPYGANDLAWPGRYVRTVPSLDGALGVLAALRRAHGSDLRRRALSGNQEGPRPAPAPAAAGCDGACEARSLHEGVELVRSWGWPVPAWRRVDRGEPEAIGAAAEALATPLVVKADSMDHKSAAGLVTVGVTSVRAAEDSGMDLFARGCTAIVLQEQVAAGAEVLVGCVDDPDAGPVLVVGRGGTATDAEPLREMLPLPVTRAAVVLALELLGRDEPSLRLAPGPRDRLADLCLDLGARFGRRCPHLSGIELNPVIVGPDGLWVVDVRTSATPVGA